MVAKFVLAWSFRQARIAEIYVKTANHLGRPCTSRERSSVTAAPHEQDTQRDEDLCDRLLAHMLECDACLNPESNCTVYGALTTQIQSQGGGSKPAVYAI